MRGRPIPELERRRRQLEVIEKKRERARLRKDEAAFARDQLSYDSTEARIAELEAADEREPAANPGRTDRRRGGERGEHFPGPGRRDPATES